MNDFYDQRPKKSGYLLKQTNSVFDLWNSRYFCLDGTNLLYFLDENSEKPRNTISLKGCVIDGIWPKDSIYTFTIRSLANDELFYYMGALTESDAQDWIKNLKASTQLIELEEITNELINNRKDTEEDYNFALEHLEEKPKLNFIDNSFDKKRRNNNTIEIPKKIEIKNILSPELEKCYEIFKKIIKSKEINWNLIKHDNLIKIYSYEEKDIITYKATLMLDCDFSNLLKLFQTDFNYLLWNQCIEDINILAQADGCSQIFECLYFFIFQSFEIFLHDFYLTFSWAETNDKFFMIRKSIKNLKSKRKQRGKLFSLLFPILLDFPLQGFKIQKLEENSNKCLMNIIIQTKKFNFVKKLIVQKFIIRYLTNFTLLKWDWFEILEELNFKEKIENTEKLEQENELDKFKDLEEDNEKIENINPFLKKSMKRISSHNNNSLQVILDSEKKNIVPYDRKSELDQQKFQKFIEFKKMVEPLKDVNFNIFDDNSLIRYLMARNFDIKAAFQMITKSITFRKEFNYTQIKLSNFQEFHKLGVFHFIGNDKKGRPILYSIAKNFFSDELDMEKYKIYFISIFEELILKIPKNHDQFFIIIDAIDITSRNSNLKFLQFEIDVLQNQYPERLYKLIAVNMDWFSTTIWHAVKNFLKTTTREKINLVGDDKNKILSVLLEEIDMAVIPIQNGGQNNLAI